MTFYFNAIPTIDLMPTISIQPSSIITIADGASNTITSGCAGGDAPTTGQWQRSTNSGATWGNVGTVNATTYTINAVAADHDDQYRFTCTDSDGDQAISTTTTLNVTTTNHANWATTVLPMGSWGFVTGLDMSSDGSTIFIRTDVYGGYVWSTAEDKWLQICTSDSLPAGDVGPSIGGANSPWPYKLNTGIYEVAVSQADPDKLWMAYNQAVYRSDNRGVNWTKVRSNVTMSPNARNVRTGGGRMDTHPTDPDTMLFGTEVDGIIKTTNGGTTWTTVLGNGSAGQTFTAGGSTRYPAFTGIKYNKTNPSIVYAHGNGVFRSTDGGNSFTNISTATQCGVNGDISSDGSYYTVGVTNAGNYNGTRITHKFVGVTRTTMGVNGANQAQSIAVSTANPSRVIVGLRNGTVRGTDNAGASWTQNGSQGAVTRSSAANEPGLGFAAEEFMSNANMKFIPGTSELYFAQGIGVWTWDYVPSQTPGWDSISRGIEELVGNGGVIPADDRPVTCNWDRALFKSPSDTTLPQSYAPGNQFYSAWYVNHASNDLSFLVSSVMNHQSPYADVQLSGYSTNNGNTWNNFNSIPLNSTEGTTFGGGCIAASTSQNFVWTSASNKGTYYTTNGGNSWSNTGLSNVHTGNYSIQRTCIASGQPNEFIALTSGGTQRSTNGGVSWTQVNTINPGGFHCKVKASYEVPGKYVMTNGHGNDQTSGIPLRITHDSFTSNANVPGVNAAYDADFGAIFPGETLEALYVYGYVNNQFGLHVSQDGLGASWVRIFEYPVSHLDRVRHVDASNVTPCRIMCSSGGDGHYISNAI